MLSSHPWLVPFATQADPGMYTPGQAHSFARSLAPSPWEGKARASISLALSDRPLHSLAWGCYLQPGLPDWPLTQRF